MLRCRQRAAASSTASGMPSRRWQTWAMAAALVSFTVNDGRARRARSTNRLTASYCDSASTGTSPSRGGDGSDGTRHATSPATPSCSRLVASTDTSALAPSTVTTNSAHSAIRCSQLSRITNERPPSPSSTAATSAGATAGVSGRPNALSVARPTEPAPRVPASSTNHTPPGKVATTSAPTANASRVLPTPADPVSVTSRSPSSSRHELGDLGPPPDQRRQLHGQVLPVRVQRRQRRELGRQIRVHQLPDPFRAPEILQPVATEIGQGHAFDQSRRRPARR